MGIYFVDLIMIIHMTSLGQERTAYELLQCH